MAKSIKFADVCKLHLLWIPLFLLYGTAKVADSTNIWIAKGITPRCLPYTTKISVSERSVLACGFRAKALGANLFGYNNKICVIYKEATLTHNSTMVFQRVESVGNLEEIARGKRTANFIQTYFGSSHAALAVDGNMTSKFFYSSSAPNKYWIVDLGVVRNIHQVEILPYGTYLEGTEIRVGMEYSSTGNFTTFTLLATYDERYYTSYGFLFCHSLGVQGRYLSIQRVSNTTATSGIYEVLVYATMIN